jgi:hypothetical protein
MSIRRASFGAASCLSDLLYPKGCLLTIRFGLALPDAENAPASGDQCVIGVPIALDVGRDLLSPAFRVGPAKHLRSVHRAAVPVAAVHEDREAVARQDEVRSEATDPPVETEAQAEGMEGAT